MTMPNWRLCLPALAFAVAYAVPAWAQPNPAGRVKVASGAAFVVRQNKQLPVKAGAPIFEADVLKTGADGRLGVTLKDETQVSLGPGSEVRLDRFVYAPAEGRLGLALKIARGLVAYVSGRIAKLAPDKVRLETPSAIVGVRGTRLAIRAETP